MNDQTDRPVASKKNLKPVLLAGTFVLCICLFGLIASGYGLVRWLSTNTQLSDFSTQAVLANATLDSHCTEQDCLQVCVSHLPDLVGTPDPGTPDPTETFDLAHSFNPQGAYDLATYRVNGDEIKLTFSPGVPDRLKRYQADTGLHQRIWKFITTIIPKSAHEMLTTFTLKTAGSGTKIATFVHYFPPTYSLDVDIFALNNMPLVVDDLVRDTGQLITINKDQLTYTAVLPADHSDRASYDAAWKKCGQLLFQSWCAAPDAYINLFYQRFWQDQHEDELYQIYYAIYHSDADYGDIGTRLYKKRPDEFLNKFAASDVPHDIAVSFEYFVLGPKPEGRTIAEQKILFFYDFPELVQLREQIISGICSYAANH